jgi:cobalt-zinc-cadmium efflux system membrane fusion protein
LAEVESLQLRNLQGELLESQAKLIWTSRRVRRLESIAGQHITSKKELWQLQTSQRVLEYRVASAMRRLTMIGIPEDEVARVQETDLSAEDCDVTLLRSIPIRAPIDGAVASFDVVPGQIVNAQNTLFEIHDTSTVWVKGYVFQRDASDVRPGQEVSVTFQALPGETKKGTVVRVSPVLSASERVLPLWVEVNNGEGHLIEGMLARVEIETGRSALTANGQPESAGASLEQH